MYKVFLKALSGRLYPQGKATFTGDVYFDGENIKSADSPFLLPKIADYIESNDILEPTLTVEETLQFAWMCTTGGNYGYGVAKDQKSFNVLNDRDSRNIYVNNILRGLGLYMCKDTYIGNAMLRGISGGQKRRVTLGEKLVCPRSVS